MNPDLRSHFEAEAAQLRTLFTSVMLLDRDLCVRYASETLTTYMPALAGEPRLNDAFTLVRPRSLDNYQNALSHGRGLLLLTAANGDFAVRGQLLPASYAGQDCLVFCGAPWLSWMVANRPEVKLRLQDFSPQDVQLDQLFYMSTEARMVADLEQLNSELKQAKDEADAAQASKNAFFARMSHEMRTPLNGVVSALSLMRDEEPGGRPGELLELASKSSSNLMQVINYVLDVSKLESDETPPEEVEFDLPELVGSVNDVVRARALEKGLELSSHCAAALPRWCRGDAARLRQSLLNLVINAIKFTESGSVTIDVEPLGDDAGNVRFEVQDTGRGIRKAEHATIFEPFTSLPDSTDEGTGLGLDIARRNVQSMGGKIGVSSAPDVGSTFWIELPLQPVAEKPTGAEPAPAPDTEAGSEPLRFQGNVLLVDDNETNLMLGTMILERMGMSVSQAISGEVAVQMALAGDYDLVLMDISMPGIDGYEATRRIREWRDAEALPIVALTAYASSAEQAESVASGMNGYLTKPIDRERLAETLANWLKRVTVAALGPAGVEGADTEPALVDVGVVHDLQKQIGLDNLGRVIGKFTEEAGRRWQALEGATDKSDLAREAHTLASTCRSFGLPAVADRLKLIEAHAKSAALESPPDLQTTGSELSVGLLQLNAVIAGLNVAQ
jgi:signal transduction histidine kinase/CheY-like chemotaxis protein/HPt (histidine-containing phosphotransfer) domain-containing protein